MKKIFILMILLSVLIFASELKSSINSQYEKAIKFYNLKDFENSYEILSKLYLTKLSNAKINFYLGRCAYETGHYEVALAAFERVEMLDSSNLRSKLEMARTYFMLKMYEESQLRFEEVLENPNIHPNVKTNIEIYLSKVKKVQQKSFTYANINIDWIYDSNVNYGSFEDEFTISIGTFPTTAQESDMALQLYVDLVNLYDIGSKNGFVIKNNVNIFLKEYQDFSAYNVEYFAYKPTILYRETKYLTELTVGVDTLKLDSAEYLRTISVTPRFIYNHTNILKSIMYFKYKKKDFTQTLHHDLNADHYELSYSLKNILSPLSYIQTNIIGILEKKESGSRVDVDYNEYKVSLSYTNQFNVVFSTGFFAEYKKREYKDYSSLFNSTRVDDGGNVVATIDAKVFKTIHLHFKGSYNKVESNQKVYSYQKYTLTAGINKTF